jgi:phosphoadenosine phosphosulfate reductase
MLDDTPSPRASPASPLAPTARGEGRGEGQPHTPTADGVRPLAYDVAASLDPRCEGSDPFPAGRGDRSALPANGDPDPDGPIWRGTAFYTDGWTKPADNEPLLDVPVVLSKTGWLAERDRLAGRNAPLGLQIEPGEAIDDLAADLPRFALIALSFPKFADGRAFSLARLLREKYGFAGELRAVGAVLSDQIPYMRRVGFDAFAVTHAPTRRALAEGRIPEVTLYYQPATADEPPAGTRPWLRRHQTGSV